MYKILTISCIASCMLNTALGENNQFLKKMGDKPFLFERTGVFFFRIKIIFF